MGGSSPLAAADDTWQYIIREHGYDAATVHDLTAEQKIRLAEPRCAYVNITGTWLMPTLKTENTQAWLEFNDGEGNYFKKRVILNAQGSSSMRFPKKNISVKFYEETWGEGKTTDITFGNWIKQDAFHLKAYYTDTFRGVGKIAYDIYDDIVSDREQPLPWQRAGVATASEKATCHPLNNKFYGLYVWSLKKSHKNMGQEKDNPMHIHLDGVLGNSTIFDGNIQWSTFDVRTPKNLYCQDTASIERTTNYKTYDGDNPTELIDESFPFYDPKNPGHVLTSKVKQSLINLSKYTAELKRQYAMHPTPEAFWEQYSRRFDTQGLVDYLVHSLVTCNYDGHWKNWQWFTYDGIKWYIAPYDLDCTFGHQHAGNMIFPPEWNGHTGHYYQITTIASQQLFLDYFFYQVRERYITLREKHLIDAERYISYLKDWTDRIGNTGYEMEFAKWPDSPCLQETIVNPNWTTEDNWENYSSYPAYSSETTYYAGDKCRDSYRIWTATATTKGVRPYKQLGQIDSQERMEAWIRERISLLDNYFSYDPDNMEELTYDKQTTYTRKIMIDKHLYILKDGKTYSIDGKEIMKNEVMN